AAHSASSLSCRQGLNLTAILPRSLSAFSSCNIKEDLPLPHFPSIDRVSGGLVAGFVRNSAMASTYGVNPMASLSDGWSLMLEVRMDASAGSAREAPSRFRDRES